MTLELDHAVVSVHDLDHAMQDFADMGFSVIRGGVHANRATHNALIAFPDETYLELLASTGKAPAPNLVDFSPMLKQGEGFAGFALRTDDIEAEIAHWRKGGFSVTDAIFGSRDKAGRVIAWKLALINQGFMPFLIQDMTLRAWRIPNDANATIHANGITSLQAIDWVATPIQAFVEKHQHFFGYV